MRTGLVLTKGVVLVPVAAGEANEVATGLDDGTIGGLRCSQLGKNGVF